MGAVYSYLLMLGIGASAASAPEDALTRRIFEGYNSLISPYVNRRNSSTYLQVSISLAQAIISNVRWTDPRLRWDPSSYGEITEIAAKSSAIWQPDVYPCESSTATTILPEANSAQIRYTGAVVLDVFQIITFNCPMNFDAFPFDMQRCLICFALEGFAGSSTVDLIDGTPERPELLSNSEWSFVGNLSIGNRRTEKDGVQIDRVGYHYSLARSSFFWVTLIIIPTCLICIVALVGIFFVGDGKIVENAVTIGLTTMTSLMLVVTILSDALPKADNLPGLGWFVLLDIGILCVAVIAALILDHLRSLVFSYSRRKDKAAHYASYLISKTTYRVIRVFLFLLSILGIVLNVALSWSSTSSSRPSPFDFE